MASLSPSSLGTLTNIVLAVSLVPVKRRKRVTGKRKMVGFSLFTSTSVGFIHFVCDFYWKTFE